MKIIKESKDELSLKIKDWYKKNFSDDELGDEIDDRATFGTLYSYLKNNKEVYDILANDSIVRERCFKKLSKILNVDYDNIYYMWLNESKKKSIKESASDVDDWEVNELTLYIENDSDLYHKHIQPAIQNLARKKKSGKYDADLAVKLWQYIVDADASKYKKDMAYYYKDENEPMPKFTSATRKEVAKELRDRFDEDVDWAVNEMKKKNESINKKVINEGPGAGYTIEGTISDVSIHHFTKVKEYDDSWGRYEKYDTDIMAMFEDCEAYSYMYGGKIGDVPIKIISVSLNVPMGEKVTNEYIEDSLNGAKIKIVYGGGWSHSTFDGHIETDYNHIKEADDIDSISFDFINEDDIEYLDDVVQGNDLEDGEDFDECVNKKKIKEAYGWANDYWHDISSQDEMKKSFYDWLMKSDASLQKAHDWYTNQDKSALHELVVDYLDETYVPKDYYKTFESNGEFGVRDKNTNELLFKSDDSRKVDDWIDSNDIWSDETYDMWYKQAKRAVNELGYYQWSDEDMNESYRKRNITEDTSKKFSDIIRDIDDHFYYLQHHNKNLTKQQEYKIDELQDLVHELRIALSKNESMKKKSLKESYYDVAYDVIQDLVDRAEMNYDGDESDAIMQAIDEGLIYTSDIWALGQYYHSIDDGELIQSYFEDLFDEIYEKADFGKDDEDEEDE